uniref:Uncharacterized protein n=1 Tax=Arundo donax TaxID=35708 RepID=A0A0A8ZSH8_ARUDO
MRAFILVIILESILIGGVLVLCTKLASGVSIQQYFHAELD